MKAPPIGIVRGELNRIQLRVAKITLEGQLVKSVDELYKLITLENVLYKCFYFGGVSSLLASLLSIQVNLGYPKGYTHIDSRFKDGIFKLHEYINFNTLFTKWSYEIRAWWWKKNCK